MLHPATPADLAAEVRNTMDVKVARTPEHYQVTVDGHRHTFMLASRDTAERERDRALRVAAAWQTILDLGHVR